MIRRLESPTLALVSTYLVIAQTHKELKHKGINVFIVEKGMPGFTVGPKEARAWTVYQGAKAPQSAGVIHTDFERGFICAETVSYDDYVACNGEQGAKLAGKLRQEGRDYLVKDGDIFHFRFNV